MMVLAEELRDAVLSAALSGKLTKQLSTDTLTENSLRNIDEFFKRQYDEKKLSPPRKVKEKEETTLTDIPDSWCWIQLFRIINIKSGDGLTSKEMKGGDIPVYGGNGITGYHTLYNVDKPTVVIGRVGAKCGSVHITENKAWVTDNAFIVTFPDEYINTSFLMLLLISLKLGSGAKATAQPVISGLSIYPTFAPLPPIEEQQRIVDRVNELMEQIDEYAKIEQQLISVKESFPGDLRSAILQAAMQGKLTERSVDDMDVDDLIRHARNERKLLIDNKDIKNEKLTEISDEDYPYEIPDSWRFIRLGEVIRLQSGQDMTPDMYSDVISEGVPYLTGASNIDNGRVIINRWTKSPKAIAEKGDLLLTCKGTVGLLAFLNEEQVHIARQIMSIKPLALVNLGYIKYCIDSFILLLRAKAKSEIPGIDRKVVLNLLIPLPPIEEQGRIVERLEGLLPLCESVMEE